MQKHDWMPLGRATSDPKGPSIARCVKCKRTTRKPWLYEFWPNGFYWPDVLAPLLRSYRCPGD